jgi:hypothetical protein
MAARPAEERTDTSARQYDSGDPPLLPPDTAVRRIHILLPEYYLQSDQFSSRSVGAPLAGTKLVARTSTGSVPPIVGKLTGNSSVSQDRLPSLSIFSHTLCLQKAHRGITKASGEKVMRKRYYFEGDQGEEDVIDENNQHVEQDHRVQGFSEE